MAFRTKFLRNMNTSKRILILRAICWSPVFLTGLLAMSVQAQNTCDAQSKVDAVCTCDVRTLRPLQGALGLEEVEDKAAKIEKNPKKAREILQDDPIKVLQGPGGALFITDHHHGADAWLIAKKPEALCQIVNGPRFTSEAEFWSGLMKAQLVHLADGDGKPIAPEQLPRTLDAMSDDPYRSLAWRLRKDDGFCRAIMTQKEFAEFIWADWLRTRPEFPVDQVRASAKNFVGAAKALARSPAAKNLPGYIGDKPVGFECTDED
jgi:hypothetical protein